MTQPNDERASEPASAEEPPAVEATPATAITATPASTSTTATTATTADPAPDQGAPSPDDAGFGDPRVDDAVSRLQELTERPVGEHADVYDDIHRRLRAAMEEADAEPADETRA
jgi:hypothetical protein